MWLELIMYAIIDTLLISAIVAFWKWWWTKPDSHNPPVDTPADSLDDVDVDDGE